jgi:hypothetical protein
LQGALKRIGPRADYLNTIAEQEADLEARRNKRATERTLLKDTLARGEEYLLRARNEGLAEQAAAEREAERRRIMEETISSSETRARAIESIREQAKIRKEAKAREEAVSNLEEQNQAYRRKHQNVYQDKINAANLLKAAATRQKNSTYI